MLNIGQKGVAQIFVVAGLVAAIAVGVFLVQNRTNLFPQAQFSGATLSLNPSNKTIGRSCSFDVDINLNTGGRKTDGTDVILLYDPTRLTIESVKNGEIYTNYPPSSIDNKTGKVKISGLATPGQPYSGSGKFATLIVRAQGSSEVPPKELYGTANLNFDFDPEDTYKTIDTNVVENGTIADVLVSVENGTYQIESDGPCMDEDGGGNFSGDVDGDGSVDYEDVAELKRYMDMSIANLKRADMDGDGKITMSDYEILYKIVLDNETEPGAKCLDNSQCSANQTCQFEGCPYNDFYCAPGRTDCPPQPICYGTCKEKPAKPTPTPISYTCGGIRGEVCPEGYTCIYPTPNYPDAQGKCAISSKRTPTPLISCDPYQESIQCPTGYACVSVPCNAPEGADCPAVESYYCMPQEDGRLPYTRDNPPASPAPKVTSFKDGDVTGDGGVDYRDAFEIFRNLGKNECGNKYDVNKDCRVNTSDIRLVIQSYGR